MYHLIGKRQADSVNAKALKAVKNIIDGRILQAEWKGVRILICVVVRVHIDITTSGICTAGTMPIPSFSIIDTLYNTAPLPRLRKLGDVQREGSEACTIGDSLVDDVLGGGVCPGMVWEIAGESAAGKSQFALQLSLFAQLPREQKGLCGSTCYITTSATLPTSRLVQMMQANPSLSGAECNLKDIHTLATPTIPHLIHVLSERLTPFIDSLRDKAGYKPVRLLVVDALAELFHTSDKTTTSTLVERSRNIAHISLLLHELVRKHKLAVLILNEVVDVFDRPGPPDESGNLLYSEQARWFSRAHSIPGENTKEASLGMVWANAINARILLSRTGRRRFLDDADTPSLKRCRTDDSSGRASALAGGDLALIRRLSAQWAQGCKGGEIAGCISIGIPDAMDAVDEDYDRGDQGHADWSREEAWGRVRKALETALVLTAVCSGP
ncbi:hypothetical protein C0993_005679 [Termitomyces sp. T159_Od127]|nr:hypothetical protein C0993_005679 [Termitomyces sp. T159_Od127]